MKTDFLKTKEEITDWLDRQQVKNYTLVEDPDYGFVVNVAGNVNLSHQNLNFIPVKFNTVSNSFWCGSNKLTTLEFAPKSVGGVFSCGNNKLRSLNFGPITVGNDFHCQDNKLTSLEGSPSTIGGNFLCGVNYLTSLKFCPTSVYGYFSCVRNKLTSLEFCPTTVGGDFYCSGNSALGEIQNNTNFEEIFKHHQEALIKKEKYNIEKELGKLASIDALPNKGILKI